MHGQNCRCTKTVRHTVAGKTGTHVNKLNSIPFSLHMSIIFSFRMYFCGDRFARHPSIHLV